LNTAANPAQASNSDVPSVEKINHYLQGLIKGTRLEKVTLSKVMVMVSPT
jgi:hypothetical protein